MTISGPSRGRRLIMEKTIKVLIVDDDHDFTGALKNTLVQETYEVFIAADREAAEKEVRSHEPDMIILGTIMPRGDAFHFHKWMKQTLAFSNLPLMVINAAPEKQLLKGWRMEEGMQCDAEDFLARPGDFVAVRPRLNKALAR